MSNKIPCGGFYLDDMLNVNDSGELSIKGGIPYQQLVTDGDGNTRWEDKMVVDSELSDTSTNPVQNEVVKVALDALAIQTLHITVTSLDMSTMETTFTADKTIDEMFNVAGPTWCVITVPESISPTGHELVLECSSYKRGYAFGYGLVVDSNLTGGIDFVVRDDTDGWVLNFKYVI